MVEKPASSSSSTLPSSVDKLHPLHNEREGCIPEEDPLITQSGPPRPPVPMLRQISQPIIAATKDEQAKVAWEHGISEE
ncbi:hypothetical protein AMECASPLE_022052 [Ameca splendens]|uniref:Uncharacterized protein n=1 Tax=Ameca splendens TaxID=208324 RepID=A0ABV0Y3N1_9TELE